MSRSSGESGHDNFDAFDEENLRDLSATPLLELDLVEVREDLTSAAESSCHVGESSRAPVAEALPSGCNIPLPRVRRCCLGELAEEKEEEEREGRDIDGVRLIAYSSPHLTTNPSSSDGVRLI